MIGSLLAERLADGGTPVGRMVRRAARGPEEAGWDPERGLLDPGLSSAAAVVHLAGENIAEGRWTDAKKAAIRESRAVGTRRLCEGLARLADPPKVLVSASAIGIYGDRGDEPLTEESAAGSGFLADVCREWEAATEPAREAGIRVVNLRIGVVLSARGGALAKMLLPFKLGLGGRLGSGKQYLSWIGVDDVVGAIRHALDTPELAGPVNATAPSPVTNGEFTKSLGRALHRPTIAPVPAPMARLAFGEMADALLLASTRVLPERLVASGYRFRHPDLDGCLRDLLRNPR
jgi:uncharacterized protein (TIGR01777 family)